MTIESFKLRFFSCEKYNQDIENFSCSYGMWSSPPSIKEIFPSIFLNSKPRARYYIGFYGISETTRRHKFCIEFWVEFCISKTNHSVNVRMHINECLLESY